MDGRHRRSYYTALNVAESATQEQIKKAYKVLAVRYHPDKNPSQREIAGQAFQEIKDAFDVLNDPSRRVLYDLYGPGLGQAELEGSPFSRESSRSSQRSRNSDSNLNVNLISGSHSLDDYEEFQTRLATILSEQAYFQKAASKRLGESTKSVETSSFDSSSDSSEIFPPITAPQNRVRFNMGQESSTQTDPIDIKASSFSRDKEYLLWLSLEDQMQGCTKKITLTRKVNDDPEEFTLHIKVRAGIGEHERIVFAGEADRDERINVLPGNIIFTVRSKAHDEFTRVGNDLVYEQTISLAKCLSGESQLFVIPTLEKQKSKAKLDLIIEQEIISPKTVKSFPGLGFQVTKKNSGSEDARGSLLVKFQILFPRVPDSDLTKVAKKLQCK